MSLVAPYRRPVAGRRAKAVDPNSSTKPRHTDAGDGAPRLPAPSRGSGGSSDALIAKMTRSK